jgi:hypothetical protein
VTSEAEVLRTIAGLNEFGFRDVAAYCSVETGVIRRVVEQYRELFSPSPDPAPGAQGARWRITDRQSLREALQAMPVGELQAVHRDQDADAERLGQAESRLTGAGRLLETLDLLDDDTRRRTRRLAIAILRESAELTLHLAEDLEASEPLRLHHDPVAFVPVSPTLTVDLRDRPVAGTATPHVGSVVTDGGPVPDPRVTQVPAPRTELLDAVSSDSGRSTAAHKKVEHGRGRELMQLLARGLVRDQPAARHARRA